MYDPKENFDLAEIDNLYDELFPAAAAAGGEIDNLYDELVTKGTNSAITETGAASLEFLDGNNQDVFRAELLQPGGNEISLFHEDGGLDRNYR